jgi:hypothetical protein
MNFSEGAYSMTCSARPLTNGRFVPELVITKKDWLSRARTIAVGKEDFELEADAIEAARLCGLKWITDYG